MPRPSPPLTVAQLEAVAAAADVSTRTVRRYLAGASVLGSSLRRIRAALAVEGIADPTVPASAPPGARGGAAA
jgi:hypothetical protein